MASAKLVDNSHAPEFTLVEKDGISLPLSNFRGKKVILYIYPAASTPGCTTQACWRLGQHGLAAERGLCGPRGV